MKTLKNFLKEHDACTDGFKFAKDLTLEQFLNTCQRGDWILWLFKRTNPEDLRALTLAKGHCANTVRHLMKDERSLAAVDAAIAFGEGRIDLEKLNAAASAAYAAAAYTAADATYAAYAVADAAYSAAYAAAAADAYAAADSAAAAAYTSAAAAAYTSADATYATYAATYSAAKISNQKQTADICRKYLPLEIWDQSKI